MKRFAGLLLPVLLGAQMEITTVEQVSKELVSDVLQGSLNFEDQNRNGDTIKTHLNAIVAEVKRFDPQGEMCKGGGYHLSPRYSYKDQKQEFIGYSGYLSFGCEFKTVEAYNTLIEKIDKARASSVRKTEGALSWGVSDNAEKGARQGLRLDMLRLAKAQSGAFSKETGFVCDIASVNFGGGMEPIRPMMMKAMMVADSVPSESPIQRNQEIALEATLLYSCSKRVP